MRLSWTDEQVNEAIAVKRVITYRIGHAPDYTHDWRLTGELLEEMQPFVILTMNEFGWQVSSRAGSTSHKDTAGRAIGEHYLMWLAWKEQA